jgi:hypothetical protein
VRESENVESLYVNARKTFGSWREYSESICMRPLRTKNVTSFACVVIGQERKKEKRLGEERDEHRQSSGVLVDV